MRTTCLSMQDPRTLWNTMKEALTAPSQITPAHTVPSCCLRSILMLSFHLRLRLPGGLFPPYFSSDIWYSLLSNVCYIPCPFSPVSFDNSSNIPRGVQVMKLLVIKFPPLHPSSVQIFPSAPCSQTPSVPAYATPSFTPIQLKRLKGIPSSFFAYPPRRNFSSTLYPQSCWCIIQVITNCTELRITGEATNHVAT
jgi:hypothetical protein